MADLSNKTICVYDNGLYVETAIRLAREFGRVYYFKPWKESAPRTTNLVVGDGFKEIERARDFFSIIDETDIFAFFDIYDGDLQVHLESIGKRVWGSRLAERYEYNRQLFKKTLAKVGLSVNPYVVCTGITELRDYLSKNKNKWIKVDMRGDGETWHHQTYSLSERKLDALEFYYGPCKEMVQFVVDDEIPTTTEVGFDGFMVTGQDGKPQFPKASFPGIEIKNQAYIGSVIDYEDLPEQVREVNDAFAPVLAKEGFRSAFGTEIKLTDDDDSFFIDATCRQPCPPGDVVMEAVDNLGEFIWHGSVGDLVELKTSAKFGAQVMLYSSSALSNYLPVEIDDEDRRWVKLYNSCLVDGMYQIVPRDVKDPLAMGNEEVGAVVGLGDTIEEAIEEVKKHCESVRGFDTDIQIEVLGECLKRMQDSEDKGVPLTDEDIPEPEVVTDD
jgi:hypothetical protein